MLAELARTVLRKVLPDDTRVRRLPFGPAAGCKMNINYHYHLRVYLGLYELETQKWFRRLVKKGYRSFDVGGAGGYDALLLSKLSGGTEVISFECNEWLLEDMKKTFQQNSFPIQAVKGFISDVDTGEEMTLDAAASKWFVPDFIKIDIEGAEDRALRGAASILKTRKPSMIVEVHGKAVEDRCLALLIDHGYEPLIVDRHKYFGEFRPSDHNRWLICKGREL